MRLAFWLCLLAVISREVSAQEAADQKRPENLEQSTNEQLIDQLATTSAFGVGFHPTAGFSGFIAVDDKPQFGGGIIGSIPPAVSPAMKELVRRGLQALPDLLSHLSDERATTLRISAGGFGGVTWHSDEYDDRPPPGKPKATGVNTGKEDRIEKPYSLRVGDLCYVAVGQIVNRHLSTVRYQPSGCFVINSPVQMPVLARAVKAQWEGLTPDEHLKLLQNDCLLTTYGTDWGAWQRVRVYYPQLAEDMALRLLARPLFSSRRLWNFLGQELVKEQDESKWQALIDNYVEHNGGACKEVLPHTLFGMFQGVRNADEPERVAGRDTAKRILAKLYPDFDAKQPAFRNAADLYDQKDAVIALSSYTSSKIDDAVFGLLRSAPRFDISEDEWFGLAQLVEACLARLGQVHYEVNGEQDAVLNEIRKLIVDRPPTEAGPNDVRSFALTAALQFFPEQCQDLFQDFRSFNAEWTREVKLRALSEPTKPQPWMVDYLASLLDDTTLSEPTWRSYGPSWDSHEIRVCDDAAKILADNFLHVRFEFEETPEYLTQQIGKLRRVLAGEKNISFDPPPELRIPKDLPTREAARVFESTADLGCPYAFSNEREVWSGAGFQGRGGWAYDTLRFDVRQSIVVERTPLDQWNGGVNLLKNAPAHLAYCYHGDEGGDVIIRDVRTGAIVKQVHTPFHGLNDADDHLMIWGFGDDATVSGRDGRWILAVTDDQKLHSIDTTTGEHRIEWEYKPSETEPKFGKNIVGVKNSSQVLLAADFADEAPLHMWDQATRTMKVVEKAPTSGWKAGWGNLAWSSNEYCEESLWDIERFRQIPIPQSDDPIREMTCDGDQSTLFVARGGGIDVYRVIDAERVDPFHRLLCPVTKELLYLSLVVSTDEKTLFVHGWHKKSDDEPNERGTPVLAIFDVSDLTE